MQAGSLEGGHERSVRVTQGVAESNSSLLSVQEARVALGNSYASLVPSKLPACIHIKLNTIHAR